jgi:hypothetical protein
MVEDRTGDALKFINKETFMGQIMNSKVLKGIKYPPPKVLRCMMEMIKGGKVVKLKRRRQLYMMIETVFYKYNEANAH